MIAFRYVYPASKIRVDTFATLVENQGEAHSFKITDGLGRAIATATDHPATPGTVARFDAQRIVYDIMGRVFKTSNPAETSASGDDPAQWTLVEGDAGSNWIYTQQTYDWKGRPRITTNQDGTTKTAEYSGCGCAGGEVVTLTDEGTGDEPNIKKRQQKIYSDVLGRAWKTEVMNWDGTGPNGTGPNNTVYSTTVTTFNVRDQVTNIREYQGTTSSTTYRDTTMTYDGFGRLKEQHQPHQQAEPNNYASSDHATFYYNADDTIDYLIDARGVVKDFTYNNRHLVTSVTYYLGNIPTAYNYITSTADQTFTYDGAGNRTEMADGTGTISYEYNLLSQLTSETRHFAGLPSASDVTLSYQYNVAGQLKKITDNTNQTNTTINYDYNKSGALTAVTGEDALIQSVSQYASGLKYRAWGALKEIQLGNGTQHNTSFNERLLPIAASLSNVASQSNPNYTMSWTYGYYLDGRQRKATDANDDRFTRRLEYDHVGRLTEAYSGLEADGQPPTSPIPNSPYRQTFSYNAFNDRTQKTGRFWRTSQSGSTPCVPRQTNDGCDGEGNVLTLGNRNHTYDAQAKQVNFNDWTQTVGGSPNHPTVQPAIEIAQTYDADGQPAKRIETRRNEELIGGGPDTNITESIVTTYCIYSSSLGGAKVLEIDSTGQKLRGYVYANGTRLAKHEFQFGSGSVSWHHSNPGTNSWIETDGARYVGREEMDPDGAEVGTADPWVAPPEPPNYENLKGDEPLYIEGGDPFDYVQGFTFDGMPMSKSQIARMLGKAGASRTILADEFLINGRMLDVIGDKAVHYMGIVGIELPQVTGGTGQTNRNLQATAIQPQNSEQRLTENEYLTLRSHITKALESKACRDFIDSLVSYNQKGKRFDSQKQLPSLAEDVYKSPEGGIFWRPGHGGQQNIKLKFWIGKGAEPFKLNSETYANELTHLLIHYVTTGSDNTLSENIRDLGIVPTRKDGTPLDYPTGMRDGKPFNDFSNYWDTALRRRCFPNLPF